MSDAPLLAGIDLGTTSIKAGIFLPDGCQLAQAGVPTPTYYPQPGWAYHRAGEVWQSAVAALRQAIAQVPAPHRPEQIESIAVASMGEAGVPLDAHGTPLADVIAWFDRRTQPQVDWLARTIGTDRIFAITGVPLQPIFGLCKLLWLKEHQPEALARATVWLNAGDYIAYRLCGVLATDHSLASRMLTLDLRRLRWSEELLAAAGLSPRLLAPLVPSGTRLGTVTKEAAEATGLPVTAQVAAGGHDHDCGALAAGVVEPGDVLDSLGTAEALFLPLARPIADPALGRQGYSQGAHVVPGRYYVHGGIYTSGASVDWLRAILGAEMTAGHEALIAEAAAIPPGSLGTYFVPHLRLANPPQNDPRARGAFVGLTTDVQQGALYRAVLEGLAYEARLSLETLLSLPGMGPLRRLIAIGGSTRNRLFMQIKASVLNQTIDVADLAEAVSLGAAMLGGLGAGVYPDVSAALRTLLIAQQPVAPRAADAAAYERRYQQVYRRLYATLRDVHHTIAAIES